MTNAEYLRKEFEAACLDMELCDFIKEYILPMFNKKCEGLYCDFCDKILAMWAAMEYKKPELNPGDPIWVRSHEKEEWRPALFIKYDSFDTVRSCFLNQYMNDPSTQLCWNDYKFFTKKEKDLLRKQVNPHTPRGTWIKVRQREQDPWKIRKFIKITNDLKAKVDECDYSSVGYYSESTRLTDEDYYNMKLSN